MASAANGEIVIGSELGISNMRDIPTMGKKFVLQTPKLTQTVHGILFPKFLRSHEPSCRTKGRKRARLVSNRAKVRRTNLAITRNAVRVRVAIRDRKSGSA